MDDSHFDMHEDITETRRHLAEDHNVAPEVSARALGQGPAEVLASQHERLHRKRWFFTFGIGMFLVGGRVRQGRGGDVIALPLGGHYVTILANSEDEARSIMVAIFGGFAGVYDDQRGHEIVQRHDMTPLLAGGDLE